MDFKGSLGKDKKSVPIPRLPLKSILSILKSLGLY